MTFDDYCSDILYAVSIKEDTALQDAIRMANSLMDQKVHANAARQVGGGEANRDSNAVTGTFLLNNSYASMIFDSGADRSFVSTTFSSLIDIIPTALDVGFHVGSEIATPTHWRKEEHTENLKQILELLKKEEFIKAAPFEALYGHKCQSPVYWTKKSYVDVRRKPLEFQVGDKVLLKVSPWKGVIRFGKQGKLNPRYIRPFKVQAKVGPIFYRLELPQKLSKVAESYRLTGSTIVDILKDVQFFVRGVVLGIELMVYGREKQADTLIKEMTKDKDHVICYGGMCLYCNGHGHDLKSEDIDPHVEAFRQNLEKIIRNEKEDTMSKIGAILATIIINAGGRNVDNPTSEKENKAEPEPCHKIMVNPARVVPGQVLIHSLIPYPLS
nr:reverse transcriptase domain-containing protein [Tanacetum cinerariifolium]